MKQAYKNLTGVDVERQKELRNERAKGYIGEFEVLSEILQYVEGKFKVLMNLNVPIDGKKTEIDLLMIHETGIYVFEVKNYKGIIYGDLDGKRWTQYFRTVKNNTFQNPMLQNEYHIRALRKLGMNQPMKSVVVFSNHECELRLNSHGIEHEEDVVMIYDLATMLNRTVKSRKSILSLEEIDRLFNLLKTFTDITEPIEVYETQERIGVQEMLGRLQQRIKAQQTAYVKLRKRFRLKVVGIMLGCLLIIGMMEHERNLKMESELEVAQQQIMTLQEKIRSTESEIEILSQKVVEDKEDFIEVTDNNVEE